MYSVLVAVKENQKRHQIVSALRAVRPDCVIRQTDALENIMSLVRLTMPDVFITTLDQQRHETLHLLDDLQLSAPQVSAVVVLGVEDFALLEHAVRAGAADYLLYPFKETELSRLLQSIEERREALYETSMFAGMLSRGEKTPALKNGEDALRAFIMGESYDLGALQPEGVRTSPYLVFVHGQGVHELLYAYLSGAQTIYDAAINDRGCAFLVYPREDQGQRWLRTQLLSALSHARHGDYAAPDIGVSAPIDDVENGLSVAFMQSRTALTFMFYAQGGSLTLYEDLSMELTRDASIAMADENALMLAIDQGDKVATGESLRRIFMHMSWPRSRSSLVLRALNRLCARLQAHHVDTRVLEESLRKNLRFRELEQVFIQVLAEE